MPASAHQSSEPSPSTWPHHCPPPPVITPKPSCDASAPASTRSSPATIWPRSMPSPPATDRTQSATATTSPSAQHAPHGQPHDHEPHQQSFSFSVLLERFPTYHLQHGGCSLGCGHLD